MTRTGRDLSKVVICLLLCVICALCGWLPPAARADSYFKTTKPLADNAYNLGSDAARWQHLHLAGAVYLYDDTHYVGFRAGTLAASLLWTLPTADGSNGQVLTTNGSGALSWASAGSGTVTAVTATAPVTSTGGATPDIGLDLDANTLYKDGSNNLAVKQQMSVTADASGLKLSGDSASPGNSYHYGTNGSGTKGWYADAAVSHNLLSATHTDTSAASVVRGDVLVGNSTPAWGRVAAGTSGQVLGAVGLDTKPRWELEYLCEQMLYRVLSANINTKPGATTETTVTYVFGDNSGGTDNNSIIIKTGTWTNAATYVESTTLNNTLEIPFVGSQIVVYVNQGGTTAPAGYLCTPYVDGVEKPEWDQESVASKTYSSLGYGVHVLMLKVKAGSNGVRCGKAEIQQYPYQGCAVSGDECVTLWVDNMVHVSTAGAGFPVLGGNRTGSNWGSGDFGDQLLSRLPLSTNAASDRFVLGDAVDTGSPTTAAQGYARMPLLHVSAASGISGGVATAYGQFPHAGMTIALGSGGATRGLRPSITTWNAAAELLDTAVVHFQFLPFIARITVAGSGSNFAAGDIVFGINWYGPTSASTGNGIACQSSANVATDLYKLPSSLL